MQFGESQNLGSSINIEIIFRKSKIEKKTFFSIEMSVTKVYIKSM